MTICNYYHLVFKKVTRSYFATVILAKKECTGGTVDLYGSWTLQFIFLSRIIENQNASFVC
jgi:hypothetical protein